MGYGKKEALGFIFDGVDHKIWLGGGRQDVLLAKLASWSRQGRLEWGVPWDNFESVTGKLRDAFITIPAGRGLVSPINNQLGKKP